MAVSGRKGGRPSGATDPAQWPSQAWVARYDEYYNKTSAPEDLPPME